MLDEFKDEIHALLRRDPRLPAVRVRELIEPLGFVGGQTIVNEYLREVRPLFLPRRTFQRTVYRPGEVCLHAGSGRPTESYAAFCGQLKCDWCFCEPADPQAKGVVERLQGYLETNFEPGRRFANHLDFQLQLDAWFAKANQRTHKTLRCRPVDRLAEELATMTRLPARELDLDERHVIRVPADPHVRVDTNDYSIDPAFAGRRVEVRVSQREITAIVLDTGELACRHERSFARHRTVTALEHARALRSPRREASAGLEVEVRPLSAYDRLIA